ncbi:hypothetical protein B1748_26695 [Paenibacillus sp. MY03]|jgi:transposase|uniref:helix-turn-helix domain-containing protein n=1 Tax=Paenibacillus sp. MY03 TaxID=302980 RepID=UPI000B3D4461|nr:helix-turn-helix domain-containing protein [Paenibacillus sp. MY03]OUS71325.1 hypothetical protein B1748_26695 [Paenibacillus sp. MY03]
MFLSNERDRATGETGSLESVEHAMKRVKDRRMYERYQALYLHLKGYSPEHISDIQNRHVKTIKSHIKAFEEGGLDALKMDFSTGAPPRLTEGQLETLVQIMNNRSPKRGGYSSGRKWTLQAIATCIEREFGYRYSLRGVSKLVERHAILKDSRSSRKTKY